MAATTAAYDLAEQYRLQAIAARDAAAAAILATFEQTVAATVPTPTAVFAFAGLSSVALSVAILEQVRLADLYLSSFLALDTGFQALPLGLTEPPPADTTRLYGALQTAASRRSTVQAPDAPTDWRPARPSVLKVTETEQMQAGRRALTEAMTAYSPPATDTLTFAEFTKQNAIATRAARQAAGLAPGPRPRPRRTTTRPTVTGWRRLTGPTPCDVCRALADGTLMPPDVVLRPGHPRCSCVAVPVTSAGDLIKPPTGDQLPEEINA